MPKIWVFFLLLPSIGFSENGGIHFLEEQSWQQVKARAKAEHKYILVDCFATWCGPCKRMEKMTFPVDSVGDVINKSFLAIRVQCDTAKGDVERVKNWYADAHQLMTDYHVTAYPTFLFFSPDGNLVHFGMGYHDAKEFIALAKDAMDPNGQYFSILREYREGKLSFAQLPKLELMARGWGDSATASAVSKVYIHNYLEKLPESGWIKKENLIALEDHAQRLNSTNSGIQWLIRHPQMGDSVMGRKGFSDGLVDYVVYKDKVEPFVGRAKKGNETPEWNNIKKSISTIAGDECAKRLIADGQADLYQTRKEWKKYCNALVDVVNAYEFMRDPLGNGNKLNNYAFEICTYSNDPELLVTATKWMKPILDSITETTPHYSDMVDTQAELMFKLGRKEEAISLETRGVEADMKKGTKPRYQAALDKMRAGQPTL